MREKFGPRLGSPGWVHGPPAVEIEVPCDAIELAARVAHLGELAVFATSETLARGPERWSYVAAGAAAHHRGWAPEERTSRAGEPPDAWGHVPRWVGLLPYEAARGLERARWTRSPDERPAPHHETPSWLRYDAFLAIDHDGGRVFVVGDDPARARELAAAARSRAPSPGTFHASLEGAAGELRAHEARIEEARRLIAQGDLYQVNLARRLTLHTKGARLEAFRKLLNASPAPFGFALCFRNDAVLSTTPELFLEAHPGGRVLTRPIKGTCRRGDDAADDARRARALDGDEKERAELAMVVDLERNDLGRVSETGSVRVLGAPRIETYRTLHHRVAAVVGQLRANVGWAELLQAAFPSGSVTGAPKIRAMEVIASLESTRRGLYTGALGCLRRDGSMTLAMAIRTLTLRDDVGHYHVGGGIVWRSDAAREVDETRVKSLQIAAMLAGS